MNIPNSFLFDNQISTLKEKEIKWENGYLGRGAILNDKKILLSVYKDGKCFLFNFDQSSLKFNNMYDSDCLKLEEISLISINKKSEIVIYDNKTYCLRVFDSLFKIIRSLSLSENNWKTFNDMTVDEDTNDIYFLKCIESSGLLKIDYKEDQFKIVDLQDERIDKEKFKPRFLRVLNDQIFILNGCSLYIDPDSREFENKFGDSLIFIYDKSPCKLKHVVDLKLYAMCQPWNLIFDKESNIYTTVFQINQKQFVSNERYLIKLTKHGDLIATAVLNEINFLANDIFYSREQFLFYKESCIYLSKFFTQNND